jgi:hypothetical protein
MEFDNQMRRFFGTDDLGAVSPEAMDSGIERVQVEFGLETDKGRKFAMWSLLYVGSAPGLEVASRTSVVRTFMDLLDQGCQLRLHRRWMRQHHLLGTKIQD